MHSDLMSLAGKAVSFIREKVPNEHGLFRTEGYDVEKNVWDSERCDPDDYGDFAPFMAWHDIVAGKKSSLRWLSGQLSLLNSRLRQKQGLYYPFSAGDSQVRQSGFSPVYAQNHVDFILAGNLLYNLLGDRGYLDAARSACDAISRHSISGKGFVYGASIPALHLYYPKYGFLRHKPEVSGIFIEEFSNLYDNSGEEAYLETAKRMAGAWMGTEAFRKFGICCDQVYPFINREATDTCTLGKMNTNFSCGLIRLASLSKDRRMAEASERNLRGLDLFRNEEGSFHLAVSARTGKVQRRVIRIVQNHMAMGALLDSYEATRKNDRLEKAAACMDYWLDRQSDSGLFQMLGERKGKWMECDIDTHADILTILGRFFLITKKRKYRDAVAKGAKAFSLFEGGDSFYRLVDLRTGKPIGTRNELKFLGGFLKGVMSSYTTLNNIRKIDKEGLRLLMRDR